MKVFLFYPSAGEQKIMLVGLLAGLLMTVVRFCECTVSVDTCFGLV